MPDKLLTLNDLFTDQIQDLYSAEDQLTEALPKMAEKASHPDLREAFNLHLGETRKQKERLEQIGQKMGISVEGETCHAMQGLIEEAEETLGKEAEPEVLDAALIAEAQRIEHYEIAGYGSAISYARRLGKNDLASLLEETLSEEKSADSKLNHIAEEQVNQFAEKAGR